MSLRMRYPVAKDLQDFQTYWYNAYTFGSKADYGFHEGDDLNLKTGGDSDLGQALYAVDDGKIVYFHKNSHPESGFGHHFALECDTPLGKRWFHYAHCLADGFPSGIKDVKMGEVIAYLGKSGRPRQLLPAHLHFACFKVDPITLPKGIDTIAQTKQQLDDWWESPLAFIDTINQMSPTHPSPSSWCENFDHPWLREVKEQWFDVKAPPIPFTRAKMWELLDNGLRVPQLEQDKKNLEKKVQELLEMGNLASKTIQELKQQVKNYKEMEIASEEQIVRMQKTIEQLQDQLEPEFEKPLARFLYELAKSVERK